MPVYALLSLAGPGQETMYVGVGIGIGIGKGREEKPNVLCTMCLFSSGIGLKEAVSPWEGMRGCQGGNRRAVLCQRRGCAWLGREEGRNEYQCGRDPGRIFPCSWSRTIPLCFESYMLCMLLFHAVLFLCRIRQRLLRHPLSIRPAA